MLMRLNNNNIVNKCTQIVNNNNNYHYYYKQLLITIVDTTTSPTDSVHVHVDERPGTQVHADINIRISKVDSTFK